MTPAPARAAPLLSAPPCVQTRPAARPRPRADEYWPPVQLAARGAGCGWGMLAAGAATARARARRGRQGVRSEGTHPKRQLLRREHGGRRRRARAAQDRRYRGHSR